MNWHFYNIFKQEYFSSYTAFLTTNFWNFNVKKTKFFSFKADSHIACRAHAVPLPCRAAKGLECVFPFDLHSAAVPDHTCHAVPLRV